MKKRTEITRDLAVQEVNKWLDIRKVKQSKRESLDMAIEDLVDSFMEGLLRLQEDGTLVQTLDYPIVNEDGIVTLSELTYIPRLSQSMITNAMTGIKAGDANAIFSSYICALTGKVKALLGALDSEDYKVGRNIASFFI